MQIKVVEMKYILLWYIIGKNKSEKTVERMREKKKFLSYLKIHTTGDGNPFIDFPNDFH